MTEYTDLRWSGAPAAVAAALATLGHPAYAAEGAAQDPRVAAFGPATLATVAGRAVLFALVRATEAIPAPAGVFAEEGAIPTAAVGVFQAGPVPAVVPLWKARVVMKRHRILTAIKDAATDAGPEAAEWIEYGAEMERYHPRTVALAAALGLDAAALDALFLEAAAVDA